MYGSFSTHNETAKTIAKVLVYQVFTHWGVPKDIDSDQGPAFIAALTKKICEILGIEWKWHIPYHPQAAGQVENMNQTIK